jgi:hypothetical protein
VSDQDKITSGIFNYTVSSFKALNHNKDKSNNNKRGSNSYMDEVTPLQKKQKSRETENELHVPTLW